MAKLKQTRFGDAETLARRLVARLNSLSTALSRGEITQTDFVTGLTEVQNLSVALPPIAKANVSLSIEKNLQTGAGTTPLKNTGRTKFIGGAPAADPIAALRQLVAGSGGTPTPVNPQGVPPIVQALSARANAQQGAAGGQAALRSAAQFATNPSPDAANAIKSIGRRTDIGAAVRSASSAATKAATPRFGGLKTGLAGGVIASIIAAKLFGGGKESQGIDPAVQLALAQQLGGGGGTGGGPASSSRALIDVSRLVTILKGIQQLGNLQGPVAQSGGRLI